VLCLLLNQTNTEIILTLANHICSEFHEVNQEKLIMILSDYDIQEKITDDGKDLQDKIKMYLSAKKLEGLSKETLRGYKFELGRFCNEIKKPVEDIITSDIRFYLSLSSELKLSTLSSKLSTLKSFFVWLTDNEIIPKDITRQIKPPKKEKRLVKALNIEELELLRESCVTLRERALVELFYATGCRLSEIVQLNRSSIDFSDQSVKVIGKGNKERIVYFGFKAIYHLKKYLMSRLDQDPALFVTERKPYRRMKNRAIQKQFTKIAERTGLDKNIHPHIMRHTLATLLLNNGADIVTVQNILGHENPATTQIYAQLTERRKHEQYKKFLVQ